MTVTTTPTAEVGDYFYRSWGYDQTNVNFYRVVAKTAKCIRVQEVPTTVTSAGRGSDWVVPKADSNGFGPVELKRVKVYDGQAICAYNSYSDLRAWDGTPKYQTASGYGH